MNSLTTSSGDRNNRFVISQAESSAQMVSQMVRDEMRRGQFSNVEARVTRIEELVKHMVERLRAYQPEAGKRDTVIRDSIVQNILELTKVLPILNITNDPRIIELEKRLTADLVTSPVMLRTDAKLRQVTISKADAILKKVQSYMK